MKALASFYVFIFIALPIVISSETICPAPTAFELPIQNVSLPENASRRGVFVSIGSPSPGQSFAFQLSCELNNTYIFDTTTESVAGGCSSSDNLECIGKVGGLFHEDASRTWSRATDRSILATASENPLINPNHTADIWGTDVFALTPEKNISNFQLGISRGQGETMNSLGLGRNSTLLNALVDNRMIAAKTWGFWRGWTGAEPQYQIDGNLVLGGYDAEKITGPNITLPTSAADNLNTDCYLATVTDIKMNLQNGSSPSLFGPNRATVMRACVEPHFDTLSLSQSMWESFLAISGSTYVNRSDSVIAFYGMLIEAEGAYDGDLTISIDPGLDITIPSHQLVVPDYDIGSNGQMYIKNTSNREVLINSLQQINGNDKLVLGLPFFTSAYMMVDNDRQQFTLWKSEATRKSSLVAMPAPNCQNATAAAQPSASASEIHATVQHTPVPKGTIAGAVLGGVAVVTLFISGLLLLLRRSRAQRHRNDVTNSGTGSRSLSPILYKPELASDRQPPQEMPIVRDPGQESAPYEMLEERAYQELPAKESVPLMHEMPVATPGRRHFELPGLPPSPRPVRNPSMPRTR